MLSSVRGQAHEPDPHAPAVDDGTPRALSGRAVPPYRDADAAEQLRAIEHGWDQPVRAKPPRITDPVTGEEQPSAAERAAWRAQRKAAGYRSALITAREADIIRARPAQRKRLAQLEETLRDRGQHLDSVTVDHTKRAIRVRGVLRAPDPAAVFTNARQVANAVLQENSDALGLDHGDALLEDERPAEDGDRRYVQYVQDIRVADSKLTVSVSGDAVTKITALGWLEVTPEIQAALDAPRVDESVILADLDTRVSPALKTAGAIREYANGGLGEPELVLNYSTTALAVPPLAYVVRIYGGLDLIYDPQSGAYLGSVKAGSVGVRE